MGDSNEVLFWFSAALKDVLEDRVFDPNYPNYNYKPMYWNGAEVTSITQEWETLPYSDAVVVGAGKASELSNTP